MYGLTGLQTVNLVDNTSNPIVASEVVVESTTEPDETSPICNEYTVANHRPRRIILNSIDSEGCIQQVGVDQFNAVAVPSNTHLGGWFVDSVLPGEKGVSLIDGHVNSRFGGDAIFQDLDKLKIGDIFEIEYGDLATKQFQVVSTKLLTIDQATNEMLASIQNITHQLNLITCGGSYNKEIRSYDERLLIISKLL